VSADRPSRSAAAAGAVRPASRPRLTTAELEERLRSRLHCSQIEITDDSHLHAGHAGAQGGAAHFTVRLLSLDFNGRSRLARHRLVYDAVSDWMPERIHALVIDARSPTDPDPALGGLSPPPHDR